MEKNLRGIRLRFNFSAESPNVGLSLVELSFNLVFKSRDERLSLIKLAFDLIFKSRDEGLGVVKLTFYIIFKSRDEGLRLVAFVFNELSKIDSVLVKNGNLVRVGMGVTIFVRREFDYGIPRRDAHIRRLID